MKRPGLMVSLFGVTALLFSGCAHAYKMEVDAEARRGAPAPVSYVVHEAGLANSTADRPPGWTPFKNALDEQMDVDQATAVKYVRTALSAKGLYEASTPEKADMDVTYAYEIQQKRRLVEWDEPAVLPQQRTPRMQDTTVPARNAAGEEIMVTVKTEVPPTPELMDLVSRSAEEIVFVKELHLIATERKPAPGMPARVWDISISYEDKDPSMDKAMPLLAAAGCDRIGTNTNGPIVVRLHDKDEVVAFIKRGM